MLLHLLQVILQLAQPPAEGLVRETRLGRIVGQELVTPLGRTYLSFTSIPYAKPPAAELRFKNPVPFGRWRGTLNATSPAPQCIQVVHFVASIRNLTFGQEDCLYLNIFTPKRPRQSSKLPVLVYLHGGAFRTGSSPPINAAEKFMEEDVVLVTLNFRLGPMGFASTEDSEIPGNFGLKDQALAIKWVHQNIDKFGGNPRSITVFGESSGGVSSHLHLTSPLTKDYLNGAIAESGNIESSWGLFLKGRIRKYTETLGKTFGCNLTSNFLQCLQNQDAKELVLTQNQFILSDIDPIVLFAPVIEPQLEGAFITENPRNIRIDKPFITGVVSGEGILKTSGLINEDDSVLDDFIKNMDKNLPIMLMIQPDTPHLSDFINLVKQRYFSNLKTRDEYITALELLYRDIFFFYPMHLALEKHAGQKFGYYFEHRRQNSLADIRGPKKLNSTKPMHTDELLSLFNLSSIVPQEGEDREVDKKVSAQLVRLWTNFASCQNPTPNGILEVTWDEYKNDNVLHIRTDSIRMGKLGFDDVFDFWTKAFKLIEEDTQP